MKRYVSIQHYKINKTGNVRITTMRSVRATIVAVENNEYYKT